MKKVTNNSCFIQILAVALVVLLTTFGGMIISNENKVLADPLPTEERDTDENEESYLDDGKITLSLMISGGGEQSNTGDIVTVSVMADSLEHITRFGPIELQYDYEHLEYLAFSQPVELESFTYNVNTDALGIISVSAIDEVVEQDISVDLMQGDNFEDNSFYTEASIALFRASFRVRPGAMGQTNFHIGTTGDFVNSYQEIQEVTVSEDMNISVAPEISSDASIANLRLTGVTLEPEFSTDIYEYSASVNRQVTSIAVNATPNNMWAAVSIEGNNELQLGDNLITINVIAQNGITSKQYRIHVTRQETYVAEGSGFLDNDGNQYTFVNYPTDFEFPEGYSQTTKTINGYSVPVFAKEGLTSVLVYLYDGKNTPAFYLYNPEFNSVTLYVPGTHQVELSRVLSVCDVPKGVDIPSGLTKEIFEINGTEIDGYVDSDGSHICYMKDEQGLGGFYIYSEFDGRFQEYNPELKTDEMVYKFFFHVFSIISALEAVIIVVTIFIVRNSVRRRKSPRPKRV